LIRGKTSRELKEVGSNRKARLKPVTPVAASNREKLPLQRRDGTEKKRSIERGNGRIKNFSGSTTIIRKKRDERKEDG